MFVLAEKFNIGKKSDLNKSAYKHTIEIVKDVLNEEYQLESICSIRVLWQLFFNYNILGHCKLTKVITEVFQFVAY